MLGLVATMTSRDPPRSDTRRLKIPNRKVGGRDAIERREAAPEDMIDPAVLARPFNGTDIRRFLYRADNTRVAPRVGADGA